MATWLASRTDVAVVGPLLDEPWAGRAASWAGVLFDLTIVGWLLWRRTRLVAYLAVIVFHVLTWRLFPIGVFPWVMIAGTLVFFPPDWPERIWAAASDATRRRPRAGRPHRWVVAGLAALGDRAGGDPAAPPRLPRRRALDRGGLLRLVPGDAHGEDRLAALRGQRPGDRRDVDRRAVGGADRLAGTPGRRTCRPHAGHGPHRRDGDGRVEGHPDVEVRADSFVSFNGRPRQRMIDPSVDLAALSRRAPASAYVLPLEPPTTD